jgi:hypothetical protein
VRSADRHRGRAGASAIIASARPYTPESKTTDTRPPPGRRSRAAPGASSAPTGRSGARRDSGDHTPSVPPPTTRGVVGLTIPLRSADLDDDVAGSLSLSDRREPHSNKTDVSVYSVHTPFGWTKRGPQRSPYLAEISRPEAEHQNRGGHVVPAPPAHE